MCFHIRNGIFDDPHVILSKTPSSHITWSAHFASQQKNTEEKKHETLIKIY